MFFLMKNLTKSCALMVLKRNFGGSGAEIFYNNAPRSCKHILVLFFRFTITLEEIEFFKTTSSVLISGGKIKGNFAISHQLHEGVSGSLEQLEQRYFAKLHNPLVLQLQKKFSAWAFLGFGI